MADLSITAANVVQGSDAKVESGVAGETITAGMAVYLKSSDGRLWKAVATSAAEADAKGIALHAALAGQPLAYQKGGSMNIGGTTDKATTYMVSAAAAGGIAPQADLASTNKIVRLGYATATDGTFVVDIRNTGAAV